MDRIFISGLLACSIVIGSSCFGFFSTSIASREYYQTQTPNIQKESVIPFGELPWLTGTILAPGGHVTPYGHISIGPQFDINVLTGIYNSHWKAQNKNNFYNLLSEVSIDIGIAPRLDITFTPEFSLNHIEDVWHWVYNDMPFGVDIQLYYDVPGTWPPAVKLELRANAPLGKYQKLDPNKMGTDIGGTGSWLPGIGLGISELFYLRNKQFINACLGFFYAVPTPVHVKGYNTYGGGQGTKGKVYPGSFFWIDLGLEYTLTRNWAVALDVFYLHNNRTRFKGRKGSINTVQTFTNSDNIIGPEAIEVETAIGFPSSEQFSVAPAMEYNFNANFGILAGVWFSVAGRNSLKFSNGIISFSIYI